jgi:hypothetical protein
MIPDKSKIEEIIKELQRILRIQDWDIMFEYCNSRKIIELTSGINYACCDGDMKLHKATIYINKDHEGIDEWYNSLVHELYHLVTRNLEYHMKALLDYIKDETTETKERNCLGIYYEQLVEDLAKGFVNACPVTNFNHILEG